MYEHFNIFPLQSICYVYITALCIFSHLAKNLMLHYIIDYLISQSMLTFLLNQLVIIDHANTGTRFLTFYLFIFHFLACRLLPWPLNPSAVFIDKRLGLHVSLIQRSASPFPSSVCSFGIWTKRSSFSIPCSLGLTPTDTDG